MNCKKCGMVLEPNQKFCSNCGEQVDIQQNQNNVNFVNEPINTNETINVDQNLNIPEQNSNQTITDNNANNIVNDATNATNVNNSNNSSNNKFGTISIVLAIVGILISFMWPFIGLVMCIVGLVLASKYKKETNNKTAGKALNIIGIIISVITLLIKVILVSGLVVLSTLFTNSDTSESSNSKSTSTTSSTSTTTTKTTKTTSVNSQGGNTVVCSYNGTAISDSFSATYENDLPVKIVYSATLKDTDVSVSYSSDGGAKVTTSDGTPLNETESEHYLTASMYGLLSMGDGQPGIESTVDERTGKMTITFDMKKVSSDIKDDTLSDANSSKSEFIKYYTNSGYSCK